jgi:Ca2+-binding EF-hand superfamily protein
LAEQQSVAIARQFAILQPGERSSVRNHPTFVFFALLLNAASASLAQSSGGHLAGPLPVPVPRAAFITAMDAEFRQMDADKNGIVTSKEMDSYRRVMAARAVDARRQALFTALDSDKNGSLSPVEFAKLPMDSSQASERSELPQTDLNHDGSISVVEYRTAKLANFDRMDTDKDGVVTVSEMKAAGVIK